MIIGIDPSLTNTAVCIGTGVHEGEFEIKTFSSKNNGDTVSKRIDRYDALVADITDFVKRDEPISGIFIEGYAFGARDPQNKLGEFGGILRYYLVDVAEVYEVAPQRLKKFVCGKGGKGATKNAMGANVVKKWGHVFDSDDEVDAFGLFALGLYVMNRNQEAPTQPMREVVQTIRERM